MNEINSTSPFDDDSDDLDSDEDREWVRRVRFILDQVPDAKLRGDLWEQLAVTCVSLRFDHHWERERAEESALGQLVFQLLEAGVNVKIPPPQGHAQ